jgi:hypothetical protein
MGNSGEPQFAAQLETWASSDDPVLAEAADWALRRLRNFEANRNQAPQQQQMVVTRSS